MGSAELVVALSWNVLPWTKGMLLSGENLMFCLPFVTRKLVVTSGAASMSLFPTWLAAKTTLPTPVNVT